MSTTERHQVAPGDRSSEPPVTVIGVGDDRFELLTPEARRSLESADVVVGVARHLRLFDAWAESLPTEGRQTVEVGPDLDETVKAVRRWAVDAGRRVCVLAAGDPGFFGVLRTMLRGIDRTLLRVLPAPPGVPVAFARLGLPWDDALVVSAAGRSLAELVGAVRTSRKVAVLTSATLPAETLGQALLEDGTALDLLAVCSRIGRPDEVVEELGLPELAAGRFDPDSVVVLVGPGGLPLVGWGPGPPGDTWGELPGAMPTTSDARAVVLQKLALPTRGVLWDLATTGPDSVAIECAVSRPDLTVMALPPDPENAAGLTAEALRRGAAVHVVSDRAPGALERLPDPDRAYVTDLQALDAVMARLRPGGRVVARLDALDVAVAVAERLGSLVQIQVSPVERGLSGWRITGADPVFVAWGPA